MSGGFREWTVFQILFFLTFLISGLAVNLIQAVLFLTLGQANRELFRKVNYYLVYAIYGQLLFVAEW